MAKFTRLEVLNTIVNTGLVPIFYNSNAEVAKNVARAMATRTTEILGLIREIGD